jgi:hypothetical protein
VDFGFHAGKAACALESDGTLGRPPEGRWAHPKFDGHRLDANVEQTRQDQIPSFDFSGQIISSLLNCHSTHCPISMRGVAVFTVNFIFLRWILHNGFQGSVFLISSPRFGFLECVVWKRPVARKGQKIIVLSARHLWLNAGR